MCIYDVCVCVFLFVCLFVCMHVCLCVSYTTVYCIVGATKIWACHMKTHYPKLASFPDNDKVR